MLLYCEFVIERRVCALDRSSQSDRRGRIGRLKTDAGRAFVASPAVIVERLKTLRTKAEGPRPEDLIFCREAGSPWDQNYLRNFALYPALDRAKISRGTRTHGLHLFRHTAGSILHEQTGSLKRVQQLLRHSRIETTADT